MMTHINKVLILIGIFFTLGFSSSNDDHGSALEAVQCERERLCNGELCAMVCLPGTVRVDTWAVKSLNFQRDLQRHLPLPYYQLPGVHNGYQTQSNGVGIENQGLHELFVEAGYRENHVSLQYQLYSVTDQLRMGYRWIELDLWGFLVQYDDIRLCHDPVPDPRLLFWVNRAERATDTQLDWNPDNLGCFSVYNKNLETGLQEINAWLNLPENKEEIVVIYYDVKSPFIRAQANEAINTTLQVFGKERIFTHAEKESLGRWPTAQELISTDKRVIVESNSDSFADSRIIFNPTLFSEVNGGDQFTVEKFTPFPECAINDIPINYGTGFYRPLDHSVAKGPALQPDPLKIIKPKDVRAFVNCGISTTALDNVTPSLTQEMIWSWAKHEPSAKGCAYMRSNGRWAIDTHCHIKSRKYACVNNENRLDWTLSRKAGAWNQATCPDNYQFSHPVTGYENALLAQILGNHEIWLALRH